jgi:hypothetical protein
MNRAVSGTLAVAETGRPLPGMRVLVARLIAGGHQVLGLSDSEDWGRFKVTYEPLAEPADLVVLIYTPDGALVYTEPAHRAITGAELRLDVAIPAAAVAHLL